MEENCTERVIKVRDNIFGFTSQWAKKQQEPREGFGRVWLDAWPVEIPIFKDLAIGCYQK